MGKKIRAFMIAALALVFAASAVMAVRWQTEYRRIEAERREAQRIAGLPPAALPPTTPQPAAPSPAEPTPEPVLSPLPEEAAVLASVDLSALRAVNEEVVGWICIPGTELSYPMVQGADNQYYLTHNWKKQPSGGGAVFLESTCARDFSGFHTIVYAHRMRNGTMFGTLKYYKQQEFCREHPCIYVVTPDGTFRYDIFSAEEAGVRSIVYRLDLVESALQEEFVQYCTDHSQIDTGIVPDAEDRFLTLSTCTGNGHDTRWVVQAVRAED